MPAEYTVTLERAEDDQYTCTDQRWAYVVWKDGEHMITGYARTERLAAAAAQQDIAADHMTEHVITVTDMHPRRAGDTFAVGDAVTRVIDSIVQPGDHDHCDDHSGEWRLRDEFGCYVSARWEDLVPRVEGEVLIHVDADAQAWWDAHR